MEASSLHLHAAQSRGRLQGVIETRRQKLRRRSAAFARGPGRLRSVFVGRD